MNNFYFRKNLKFLLITFITFIQIFNFINSADCVTPAECYIQATAVLQRDREEMRRQLDKYQSMYEAVVNENQNLKDSITALQSNFNSKLEEINKNFESKISQLKSYTERPFTSKDDLIFESNILSTNLSTVSLNNLIPAESKKILVYVSFNSGYGYENHGEINVFTKLNGNFNKRSLKIDTYDQSAYNTNSSVYEMDLDGVDFNLYFSSTTNYNGPHFYFQIKLLGFK